MKIKIIDLIASRDQWKEKAFRAQKEKEQQWSDHFIWTKDGIKILGTTPTGRAISSRFDFNDEPSIQVARRFWVEAGWHPPQSDPRLE